MFAALLRWLPETPRECRLVTPGTILRWHRCLVARGCPVPCWTWVTVAGHVSARHRLSKLLLCQGIVYYQAKAWTGVRERWLGAQHFTLPGLQLACDVAYDTMLGHRRAPGPARHRDHRDGR